MMFIQLSTILLILNVAHSVEDNTYATLLDDSPLFHYGNILNLLKTSTLSRELRNILEDEGFTATDSCVNDTIEMIEAISTGKNWALQMLDATAKPPPGLSLGAINWPGSYQQCTAIRVPARNVSGLIAAGYSGEYCTAHLSISNINKAPTILSFGICLPSTCSSDEFIEVMKLGLQSIEKLIKNNLTSVSVDDSSFCHQNWNEVPFTSSAIVMLCVISIFVLLILSATLLELYQKWSQAAVAASFMINEQVSVEDSQLQDGERNDSINDAQSSNGNLLHDTKIQAPDYGIAVRILLVFSLVTNVSKLFNTHQAVNSETLTCVHGIRFISLSWVILGHTYFFIMSVTNNLIYTTPSFMNNWTFGAIANATISVDSFFVLSGLLTAYLFFREIQKLPNGPFSTWKTWVAFYLHRYWRLTPPYLLFMGSYVTLFAYLWDGPLWPQKTSIDPLCKTNWWTNALYINNLIDAKKGCMGWSWYLANDMQFYIISPLLTIPLYYSNIAGGIVCTLFLLTSMITTGIISMDDDMAPSMQGLAGNGFNDVYIRPWTRMGPYVIGLAAGYLLFKTKCNFRIPKVLNLLGWLVATGLALSSVYGLSSVYNGSVVLSINVSALYNSTFRIAWSLALTWVIISCCTGYGGWVNDLLSWKVFIPLSRLTYCAYLVHPVVMMFFYFSNETPFVMNNANAAFFFMANMVSAYGTAFIVSMMFEAPLLGLERILRGK